MTDRVPHLDLGRTRLRVGRSRERAADAARRHCARLGADAGATRPLGARPMSVLPMLPTHGLPRAAPALRQEAPAVTELDAQTVVL
jgi:hypothetical protein